MKTLLLASTAAALALLAAAALPANVHAHDYPTLGWIFGSYMVGGQRRLLGNQAGTEASQLFGVWYGVLAIAVHHFNTRNTAVLPAFGTPEILACNHTIDLLGFMDTRSLTSTAVEQFLTLQNKAELFISPVRSEETHALALNAGALGKPMVSYWSTSPELSDTSDHPMLSRVIPSDGRTAAAIARWLAAQNYTAISLIGLSDSFGQSFKDEFLDAAGGYNISVESFMFSSNGEEDGTMELAVRRASEQEVNVFLYVHYNNQIRHFHGYAKEHGLLDADKLIIFSGQHSLFSSPGPDEPWKEELARGNINFGHTILDNGGSANALWTSFKTTWWGFDGYVSSVINPKLSPNTVGLDGDTANLAVNPGSFASQPWALSNKDIAYFYDAIASLGLGLCAADPQSSATGTAIHEAILGLEFDGLSGPVKFAANGDRHEETVSYIIEHVRGSDLEMVTVAKYDPITQQWSALSDQVVFRSNSSSPPSQYTVPVHNLNYLDAEVTLAVVLVAFNAVFCLIAVLWAVKYRQEKVVANSQLPLLLICALGVAISGFSILGLVADDSPTALLNVDAVPGACMIFPWLYVIGFSMAFLALFVRTYRIVFIFNSAQGLRRRRFSASTAVALVSALLMCEVGILLAWHVDAPLEWARTVTFSDQQCVFVPVQPNRPTANQPTNWKRAKLTLAQSTVDFRSSRRARASGPHKIHSCTSAWRPRPSSA